ncbi:hypothetical protein OR626_08605 [Pseudomonas sp. S1Bt30]|uniref:HNH endonuclease n=1 Tax=Pseudomonas quebecensis TaxID=2995174 RepID=A0ABY6QIT9_9PSED|nr:hypothetical protein [Pseudomonas quebecensis]MCX4064280.1 hypothetical protein [Pseudomonas quebecensis]UZW19857.1 hypothetical protein OSC50_05780 [Pseudomonas quebecensis]UZW22726.1 hypothetical protein OSC48_19700 [Pseudomonas quebecensis]UZW27788.1 hypothetical protein OSC49_19705 [Pseudomonas quebecensis]
MTKATSSKATRRPTCQNPACKKRFTTSVASAKYCSAKCGDAKRNSRKRVDPLDKAAKSAFFMYLANECIRAGTIEILRGHTVESLCELHSLYVANMKWNGFGDSSAYELSHIAPVKGHDCIGVLYAENLVSAPKSLNRAHGTRHYGHGKAIHRLTLNHKLNVDKRWNSVSEVRQMVISYLGRELVCSVIKACKIKPTQRHQVTEWILAHYDPSNPTHTAALPDLDQVHNLKARELAHVKAAMLDEEAGVYISTPPTHPAIVLRDELTRLSAYRPELEVYAYALDDALATQGDDYSLFSKHHEKMLFDVLHGKSIAVMADTLEMIVGENTAHSFITYSGKAARYNVKALDYFDLPVHSGARLHKTSLAAFKVSISVRGAREVEQSFSFPLHEVVLDPWGNEVVAPF